jgi:hypothetical protein
MLQDRQSNNIQGYNSQNRGWLWITCHGARNSSSSSSSLLCLLMGGPLFMESGVGSSFLVLFWLPRCWLAVVVPAIISGWMNKDGGSFVNGDDFVRQLVSWISWSGQVRWSGQVILRFEVCHGNLRIFVFVIWNIIRAAWWVWWWDDTSRRTSDNGGCLFCGSEGDRWWLIRGMTEVVTAGFVDQDRAGGTLTQIPWCCWTDTDTDTSTAPLVDRHAILVFCYHHSYISIDLSRWYQAMDSNIDDDLTTSRLGWVGQIVGI